MKTAVYYNTSNNTYYYSTSNNTYYTVNSFDVFESAIATTKKEKNMSDNPLINKLNDLFEAINLRGGYCYAQDFPPWLIKLFQNTKIEFYVDLLLKSKDLYDPLTGKFDELAIHDYLKESKFYCIYNFIKNNDPQDLAPILFARVKRMAYNDLVRQRDLVTKTLILVEDGDKRQAIKELIKLTRLLEDQYSNFVIDHLTGEYNSKDIDLTVGCLVVKRDNVYIDDLIYGNDLIHENDEEPLDNNDIDGIEPNDIEPDGMPDDIEHDNIPDDVEPDGMPDDIGLNAEAERELENPNGRNRAEILMNVIIQHAQNLIRHLSHAHHDPKTILREEIMRLVRDKVTPKLRQLYIPFALRLTIYELIDNTIVVNAIEGNARFNVGEQEIERRCLLANEEYTLTLTRSGEILITTRYGFTNLEINFLNLINEILNIIREREVAVNRIAPLVANAAHNIQEENVYRPIVHNNNDF